MMISNRALFGSIAEVLVHQERHSHSLLISLISGISTAKEDPGHDSEPCGLDLVIQLS